MIDSTKSPRKNLKTSVGAAITMLVLLSACSQQSIDTDDKALDQTTAAQQIESAPSAESALDSSLSDPSTSADGSVSDSSTVASNDDDLAAQVQTDALPPADALPSTSPSMSPLAENDPLTAPVPTSSSLDSSVGSSSALTEPAPKHVSHKKHGKKHGKKVTSHKKHKKHGKKVASKSAHKKNHKKALPEVAQAATQIDSSKEIGSTLPTDAALSAPVDQLNLNDSKPVEAMNAAAPLDPTMSTSPSDTPMVEPLALTAPSTNWKVWGAWAALMAILVGAFVIRMKKRKGQGVYYNP